MWFNFLWWLYCNRFYCELKLFPLWLTIWWGNILELPITSTWTQKVLNNLLERIPIQTHTVLQGDCWLACDRWLSIFKLHVHMCVWTKQATGMLFSPRFSHLVHFCSDSSPLTSLVMSSGNAILANKRYLQSPTLNLRLIYTLQQVYWRASKLQFWLWEQHRQTFWFQSKNIYRSTKLIAKYHWRSNKDSFSEPSAMQKWRNIVIKSAARMKFRYSQ